MRFQKASILIATAALVAACNGCAKLDAYWRTIDEREYAEASVNRQILEREAEQATTKEMLSW
jgi:hypothetical protein